MIAVILGGALCLDDDVRCALALVDLADCLIVAVNDAGFWWRGRLDHWVTMHAEELPERERIRAERGYPAGYKRWTRPYPPGMKQREDCVDELFGGWSGSSGLLAVGITLERLGADAVLLCGMPMDDRPHFNRKGRWQDYARNRLGWIEYLDRMRGCVRSFSGWTAELLGVPTEQWIIDRKRVVGLA